MTALVPSAYESRCGQCGEPFRQPRTGRRRTYCSDACKQRAYEGRKQATAMTKSEREELAKVARMQARVAKSDAELRQRELLAQFEAQMAARFSTEHEIWADLVAAAKQGVATLDAELAQRCRDRGVPETFRPSINVALYGRGENSHPQRRAELRKVAESRLEADARKAKVEIDRRTAEICAQLAAGGLSSPEARAFLESMPHVEELMQPLAMVETDTSKLVGRPAIEGVIEGGAA